MKTEAFDRYIQAVWPMVEDTVSAEDLIALAANDLALMCAGAAGAQGWMRREDMPKVPDDKLPLAAAYTV